MVDQRLVKGIKKIKKLRMKENNTVLFRGNTVSANVTYCAIIKIIIYLWSCFVKLRDISTVETRSE